MINGAISKNPSSISMFLLKHTVAKSERVCVTPMLGTNISKDFSSAFKVKIKDLV
jgi:hypothetical protein